MAMVQDPQVKGSSAVQPASHTATLAIPDEGFHFPCAEVCQGVESPGLFLHS